MDDTLPGIHCSALRKMPLLDENNEERFHYESERFKSFAGWPINSPVDPARLAKAGFYYSDYDHETVCFSCNGHVKNWNYGDIVLKKHAELFPHCDFIHNRSNNIPATNCIPKNEERSKSALNKAGTHLEKESVVHKNLQSESERLKTFIGKWPVPYIHAVDIAHAGFFYLGSGDKVQCAYCKVILSGWECGDDPLEEHKKHFPQCDYVSKLKRFEIKKVHSWYKQNSEDVCGNMVKSLDSEFTNLHKSVNSPKVKNLGIHPHKAPAYPQQSLLSARLRSFASWPVNSAVSKDLLAEAGFFYIGLNDRTKCFHCNGGLCSWEQGDDPWIEHARWFPDCDFLLLKQGREFIEKWSMKYRSSSFEASETLSSKDVMCKVDEAMKSDLVKHVMEIGLFPSYIIRAAVFVQVKETGCSFSNVDDLCIAVSCLKEEVDKEMFKRELVGGNTSQNSFDVIEERNPSMSKSTMDADHKEHIEKAHFKAPSESGSTCEVAPEENTLKDRCLCKICMDQEVSIVFLPCGHLLACTSCAPALQYCPMCRKAIEATVRAYLN